MIKKWSIILTALAGILLPAAIAAETGSFVTKISSFEKKLATPATLEQLQAGGFVLYMRHGPTDTSRPDQAPCVDLNDCSTQRPLTKEGRAVAAKVGESIRKASIPIGEVQASPMCRTMQTAKAAFDKAVLVNNNLMYTSNLTSREKLPKVKALRRLLSEHVPLGTNRVLVAHAPNLMDLIGYFVKPEATMIVLRPLGEKGFEYIASVEPQQWPELINDLIK
jgi:phosphohistidine phosphatase SixA